MAVHGAGVHGHHRFGRAHRPVLPDRVRLACGSLKGADAGSVGRRRRPGTAAINVPTATSPPPAHNHDTSGRTNTPMTTGLVTRPRRGDEREIDVSNAPLLTDGVPIGLRGEREAAQRRAVRLPAVDLDIDATSAVRFGYLRSLCLRR